MKRTRVLDAIIEPLITVPGAYFASGRPDIHEICLIVYVFRSLDCITFDQRQPNQYTTCPHIQTHPPPRSMSFQNMYSLWNHFFFFNRVQNIIQKNMNQYHWPLLPPALGCFSHIQLLVDLMDCSPPDSSVHGILQARILEWVATPSSRGSSWPSISQVSPALAGEFFMTSATEESTKCQTCLSLMPSSQVL